MQIFASSIPHDRMKDGTRLFNNASDFILASIGLPGAAGGASYIP
jgi:hypothetical protein